MLNVDLSLSSLSLLRTVKLGGVLVVIIIVGCVFHLSNSETLSRSPEYSRSSAWWGEPPPVYPGRLLRNKRDSKQVSKQQPCDPVGWLNPRNPKFECNAWNRWGYNITDLKTSSVLSSLDTSTSSPNLSLTSNISSRICVPLSARCDFVQDCPDGSDELGCYQQYCDSESDYVCEDLTCIPREALCDGRYDCRDQLDEHSPHLFCHLRRDPECEEDSWNVPCDGKCLPKEKVCNGKVDCSSAIDESYVACTYLNKSKDGLKYSTCPQNQFKCWTTDDEGHTECVDSNRGCDGVSNCADGSDEGLICNLTYCEDSVFLKNCQGSLNSICRLKWKQDETPNVNFPDCADNVPLCSFEPSDLEAIDTCEPVCPGYLEQVCLWNPKLIADSYEHTREQILQCVPKSAFCNGTVECVNEADELLCASIHCNDPQAFHCGGVAGQCLKKSQVCDGYPDCFDARDEIDCWHVNCTQSQFYCPDQKIEQKSEHSGSVMNLTKGRCIDLKLACDEKLEPCALDSEKQKRVCDGLCHKLPDGFCGTSANCIDTSQGAKCRCTEEGFVFDNESNVCVDVDECSPEVTVAPPPCDQICTNTLGSYICSCHKGYFVDSADTSRCIAEDPNAFILVTLAHLTVINIEDQFTHNEDMIEPLNSDHYLLNVRYPPSSTMQRHQLTFAAYDYQRHLIYFTDRYTRNIYRTVLPSWNLNELLRNDTILNKTTVFKNGSRNSLNSEVDMFSEGMAVDYSSGNVYWVEREPTTQIHVTSSDGVHDMSLVREKLSQPREISLHVPRRFVFWVDWGEHVVERCNFDGSDRRTVVSDNLQFINSVAVDEFSDRIYFLDAKYDQIRFSSLDGSNQGFVLKAAVRDTVLARPFSLAIFESALIWSDWGSKPNPGRIHTCNKRRCSLDKGVHGGDMKGYLHLSVVHKSLQDVERLDSAPCLTNNGHCPSNSICVPINNGLGPGGMTHTCFTMRRATKVVKKTEELTKQVLNCSVRGAPMSEICLPTAWPLMSLNQSSWGTNEGGEEMLSISFWCYCGPNPLQHNQKEGVPVPLLVTLVLLLCVLIFAACLFIFVCYIKPTYCPQMPTPHNRHRRNTSNHYSSHRQKKVDSLVVNEQYEETSFGNPRLLSNDISHAPPPESPGYSPAMNAFDWDNEQQLQESQFEFSEPGYYDAHQAQAPLPMNRRPSVRSALPSIKEEVNEEEEEDEEEGEDVQNSSSTNSNSHMPRNYSIASSTAGLVYPSDDEVFDSDLCNQNGNSKPKNGAGDRSSEA